jgi:ADP-heptose:LPS heptosyltransferase
MSNGEPRPRSILVWLAGALGDSLLGYPALAVLRRWAPHATVTLVGTPSYYHFAVTLGLVDTIVDAAAHAGSLLFAGDLSCLPGVPDLAIIWSSANKDVAERLAAGGVPSLIAAPPRATEERHQARYLLDCLGPLGVPRPLLPVPPPALARASERLSGALHALHGRGWAVLHPGAGARWKRWPLDDFLVLAARLESPDVSVLWSLGPADTDLRDRLAQEGPNRPGILLPPLSLDDLACALSGSALVVSGDTGIAHLAALWQAPQVVLFGPTNARRWRPLSRRALVVSAPNRCGGAWDAQADDPGHALRRCTTTGPCCLCLAALPVDHVAAACSAALSGKHSALKRHLPWGQAPGC